MVNLSHLCMVLGEIPPSLMDRYSSSSFPKSFLLIVARWYIILRISGEYLSRVIAYWNR